MLRKHSKKLATLVGSLLLLVAFYSSRPFQYVDRQAPRIIQASQRGNLGAVKKLINDNPALMFDIDSKGNSAAEWAILNDYHEIAIFLIESGYPIAPKSDADFPLVMACLSRYTDGSYEMLDYLLNNGANPNTTFKPEGWVALNMAVNNGMEEKVRLLVEYGANLESKDSNGMTSLEMVRNDIDTYKDPSFNLPHGEFSDPKVRRRAVTRLQRMADLVIELGGKEKTQN